MKVRELLALLQNADPELTVCLFDEDGPYELESVSMYSGEHRVDHPGGKMIWHRTPGHFVGVGNPSDIMDDEEDIPMLIKILGTGECVNGYEEN